jgi:hypothetical protein
MFDLINFDDDQKDDYIDPDSLEDDYNYQLCIQEIKSYLQALVRRVKTREAFLGTPPASKPDNLNEFYDKLETALKHVTAAFEDTLPKDRNRHLINLALAGHHCGGRYLGEAQFLYGLLCGNVDEDVEAKSIENQVLKSLHDFRQDIIKQFIFSIARGSTVDVHVYNYIMKEAGKEFGIRDANITDVYDVFAPFGRTDRKRVKNSYRRSFSHKHTTSAVIDEIHQFLNTTILKKDDTRTVIIDWLKEHAPSKIDPVEYLSGCFEDMSSGEWKLKKRGRYKDAFQHGCSEKKSLR